MAMLTIAGGATRARGQACGAATDSTAVRARVQMRQFSASTASEEAWARRDAKVPVVDTSTIIAVTQNATCQKILAAFNAKIPSSPLPTKIYAVKVGAVYVATYPFSGHQRPWVVIDSKYKVLSTFLQ